MLASAALSPLVELGDVASPLGLPKIGQQHDGQIQALPSVSFAGVSRKLY